MMVSIRLRWWGYRGPSGSGQSRLFVQAPTSEDLYRLRNMETCIGNPP